MESFRTVEKGYGDHEVKLKIRLAPELYEQPHPNFQVYLLPSYLTLLKYMRVSHRSSLIEALNRHELLDLQIFMTPAQSLRFDQNQVLLIAPEHHHVD